MYERKHLGPLALIAAVVGGICVAVGLGFSWSPEAINPEAERVDNLMWFLYWSSAVIFTIVVSVMIYCVWKFRRQPGDETDGPPIHGNTKLEIVWTAVPTMLLVLVAVLSILVINKNEAVAADRTVVRVNAQQFAWTFDYVSDGFRTGDLRVPTGKQVELRITSADVIHSFWVPQLRLKQDATPGITTRLLFTPTKVGVYPVICAELCGLGHGLMRARMFVDTPENYAAWIAKSRAATAKATP